MSEINDVFEKQIQFQKMLGFAQDYVDDPGMFASSALGLISEIGEVLQADKRWKNNGRNKYYERYEKLKELADVFIYFINMCIYSDVLPGEIMSAVNSKINENVYRWKEKVGEK